MRRASPHVLPSTAPRARRLVPSPGILSLFLFPSVPLRTRPILTFSFCPLHYTGHRSSPSQIRGTSPVRHGPSADLPPRPLSPRYTNRFDRAESTTSPRDTSRTSPDSYASSEKIPQRRGRDYDSDYGGNTKRRRVDDTDDHRYRQIAGDRATTILPERPAPVSVSPEPPRACSLISPRQQAINLRDHRALFVQVC